MFILSFIAWQMIFWQTFKKFVLGLTYFLARFHELIMVLFLKVGGIVFVVTSTGRALLTTLGSWNSAYTSRNKDSNSYDIWQYISTFFGHKNSQLQKQPHSVSYMCSVCQDYNWVRKLKINMHGRCQYWKLITGYRDQGHHLLLLQSQTYGRLVLHFNITWLHCACY